MPNNNAVIEISVGTIIKVFLVALVIFGLYIIRDVVAIVLFSVVIASAIGPAANWFEKRHIPRVLSIILIYILVFLILGLIFYLVVPTFISEISNFTDQVPKYLENPVGLQSLFKYLPVSGGSVSLLLKSALTDFQSEISMVRGGFFETVSSVFGGVMFFFLTIILSFYLSVQRGGLDNFIKTISPAKYEKYALNLWKRSSRKIGRWLQGQILLGILVGVLVYLGLTIMRVEYALSFALLAAVFELIPYFGPILAAIPPIIIAFLQSPSLAIVVIVFYIIIQQFENHLIYPLVVQKIVGVPSIIVILSMIIGVKLGGFFGLLLAIPIATVLMEFFDDIATKKKEKELSG